MAEPDDLQGDDESLETLKADSDDADNEGMDDGIHARPRIHWDPVTDTGASGPAPTDAPAGKSAFQFDLGGALARLGDDDEDSGIVEPVPERELAEPARARVEPSVESVPPPPQPTPPTQPEPAADEPRSPEPVPSAPDGDDPLSSLRGLISDDPLPQRSSQAGSVEPLPEIREASAEPIRSGRVLPGSVFGDDAPTAVPETPVARAQPVAPVQPVQQPVAERAPVQPVQPVVQPAPAPQPVQAAPAAPSAPPEQPVVERAPEQPSQPVVPQPAPSAEAPTSPVLPSQPVMPNTGGDLPVLPDAPPAAPSITEPIESAPSTPDLHALRSAQLRADRDQRKGRLFGRSLIAFLAVAAVIALGLIFGRAYLFPTEWDPSLTPIVDEIQEAGGVDFDHAVAVEVQPADEYAQSMLVAMSGSDWASDLPQWRATGVAAGDATVDSVVLALAAQVPVVYDATTDTIYQSADADPSAITGEFRDVLNQIYAAQLGVVNGPETAPEDIRFTGVSAPADLARRAVDRFIANRAQGGDADAADVATEDVAGLPLPLAYELAAVDHLGEAVLVGANIDPATVSFGDPYPDAIATVLNDSPSKIAGGLLGPTETSLADPVALGVDDWSLIWGARLPGSTVDRLAGLVTGDSYRPIERAGTTCFVGVFQTASEVDGNTVFSSMLGWASDAPAASQAVATQLSPQRVQIEACDPGASATVVPNPGAVDVLIANQIDRLAR